MVKLFAGRWSVRTRMKGRRAEVIGSFASDRCFIVG